MFRSDYVIEHFLLLTTAKLCLSSFKYFKFCRFFSVLESLGTYGLCGLDRLFSFMIVKELQQFMRLVQQRVMREKSWMEMLNTLAKQLHPQHHLIGL